MAPRFSHLAFLAIALVSVCLGTPSHAQKKYDPGASDTEIRIGNTVAYSGPASSYGTIARSEAAYFKKINDEGGINGRKINFISYDDANSPPKAVEQTRKLVEGDEVLFIFNSVGTASNTVVQKYLNAKHVPQLFIGTGATKWGDPTHFPWTMGWQPTYQSEGRVFARYILKHHPDSKIAILWQNEDFGKDYLKGFKDGLGDKAQSMIVAERPYELSDPTVDSQVVALKASGADIMVTFSTPKAASQTIRKIAEIGWKPLHFLSSISNSVGSVIKPAGFDHAQGLMSNAYAKDPTDPTWRDDPAAKEWLASVSYTHLDVYKRQLGRVRDQARRLRPRTGTHVQRLRKGPDRSDLARRSSRKGMAGFHGQVFSRRRQDQQQQCLRLYGRANSGAGLEALRR